MLELPPRLLEKEGTTNEMLISLDLINVKDGNNLYVSVSKPRLFGLTSLF